MNKKFIVAIALEGVLEFHAKLVKDVERTGSN